MRIMVLFTAFESVVGPEAVGKLRKQVGEALKRIKDSGKLESGGVFADLRGGYFILKVGEGEELMELLGGGLLDNFSMVTHPIYSFDYLGEYFAKHPPGT